MVAHSRYDVSDEGAGIGKNGLLINKLGIKEQTELDDAETLLLKDSYTHFFELLSQGKMVFNLPTLFTIHEYFLGTLYVWAGKVRGVDISKPGVFFAPVLHMASSIKVLERLLQTQLPKKTDSKKLISEKIAIIHNELNAVHPFREGNGRTIRLFLDLMVADLDLPPIDWNVKDYMSACRRGMFKDHSKMTKIIYHSISSISKKVERRSRSNLQRFKIAVSAFIIKDSKLLILKRADDEAFLPGVWEVPGGGIDEGETIVEGVVRETMEEAGITIIPKRVFGFFEYTDGYGQKTVNLNFVCKMKDDSEKPDVTSGEMTRATWASLEELRDYKFTSEAMLNACKEALQLKD